MSRPLPRFNASQERTEDARKLDKILSETTTDSPTTAARATLPGDTRRLRGIPVQARGVGGTSPNTNPVQALMAKQPR
jgi:hypothetical protein